MIDLIQYIDPIPKMQHFVPGVLMLLCGQVLLCVGTYFYIRAGLGAGPRDSLMVALYRRMPKIPVGVIRGVIEGTVLVIGWMLGGKVGLGTVIAVFGIGSILQLTFHLLRFDVKGVRHESLAETWKNLTQKKTNA